LTAHAGEDAGPEYVWEAIDTLGATRVGHGCSAAGDPELVRRMARDQIVVECCLSSNEDTGAVKRGTRHPIHAFLEAGAPVALCTDNTTVSRTDQQRESVKAAGVLGADVVEGDPSPRAVLHVHPARVRAQRDRARSLSPWTA
jgi:adenosine deaminase